MTDLVQIRDDILNEMYAEATPSMDFDYAKNNPEEMGEDWYEQYYLSEDRQREIFQKHTDKYDLTGTERATLSMECFLNLGPTSVSNGDDL